MKQMRPSIALLTLVTFGLFGCQKESEKPKTSANEIEKPKISAKEKPKISEIFKTELVQYLKDGGKLSTQSGEGINLFTLQSQLTDAKSTFDLLEATWPQAFAPDARESFKQSHKGYDLAIRLWKLKVNKSDEPSEPSINEWSSYIGYAENALAIETYSSDYLVEDYRGKRYLPFHKNISVLLTIAGTHFNKGRKAVLRELE